MPTGREEAWRFTPVRVLKDLLNAEHSAQELIVKVDTPKGAKEGSLHSEVARNVGKGVPADLVAAKAAALCDGARHITVPQGAHLTEPVVVEITAGGANPTFDHVVVSIGDNAHATVVLKHHGVAKLGQLVSVVVGDDAEATIVSVQDWDSGAQHVSQQDLTVGRNAKVKHIVVSTGGDLVRVSSNVHYTDVGAEVAMFGAYLAGPTQHLEHRSFVDHDTPRCTSDVLYKGALHGSKARSVWVGDVLIRAEAAGTSTYELNRNLILTHGARADSVPNLEIETGQIEGAGHASATGRFDDDQLFYLQARGIPADVARKLVVRGFFADIVQRIGVPAISDVLMARIDAELDQTIQEGTA